MKNCFLLCVIGLTIACIICCWVNVTLDMNLGVEDILISVVVKDLRLEDEDKDKDLMSEDEDEDKDLMSEDEDKDLGRH